MIKKGIKNSHFGPSKTAILASFLASLALTGAGFAVAEPIEMPSGLSGYLHEVIADESADIFRFRFVAPEFSKAGKLEIVAADLEHLCAEIALREVSEGAQIIISLADQPSEFGVAAPNVIQVFEAFRSESGRCIWEEF